MNHATDWLALAYAALVAGALVAYVLMDGWDLGVGILYPLVPGRAARDQLLETIQPFWDANETWLVFGGMALLLGFPLAYASLLTRLYVPVCVMLFALVLRGVSYEFRYHGGTLREFWGHAFAASSVLAAFAQGCMLGEVVEGSPGTQSFSPFIALLRGSFPLVCGMGVIGGYALLGACWLILKAGDDLRNKARELAPLALGMTVGLLIIICIFTPLASAHVAARWFSQNTWLRAVLFVIAQAIIVWRLRSSVWQPKLHRPLQWAAALTVLSFVGVVASLYPYIVPYDHTLFAAANDRATLSFAGVGICIVLPVVILYLALGYRVFRTAPPRLSTLPLDPPSVQ